MVCVFAQGALYSLYSLSGLVVSLFEQYVHAFCSQSTNRGLFGITLHIFSSTVTGYSKCTDVCVYSIQIEYQHRTEYYFVSMTTSWVKMFRKTNHFSTSLSFHSIPKST